jgi:hypothetical protein
VHLTTTALGGLAVVAASGLIVYGASLAIAFRAGLWQRSQALTLTAATKS